MRTIDWNVTARSDQPYVKLFREERELSVMLLVDLSGSQSFGTNEQTKRALVAELGATLAMSAIRNNDRVGLTLFTDEIEKCIPPRKGSRHVLRLMRELLFCEPVGSHTDLRRALEHLNRTSRRRTVVFVFSDFQDSNFEATLRVACRKHDIISTSGEVTSFNRVPIGPRFAANRGALPTRLNDIMPNDFCRGAYRW